MILPRRVIPADTGVAIAVDVMTRESGPSTGLFPRAASCEGTGARLASDIEKKGAELLFENRRWLRSFHCRDLRPGSVCFVALARARASS